MKINRLASLSLLLCAAVPAFAQDQPFRVGGETHQISVSSTASVPERLTPFSTDQTCTQIQLANIGSTDAYVELAATSAEAVPDPPAAGNPGRSLLVKAGTTTVVGSVNKPYISAKTSSSTTTLNAGCGSGSVSGVASNNVFIAGSAGTVAVEGEVADGASAASTPPVVAAGVDGSGNAQSVLTDTSGRQVVIGAGADGAALVGPPVLMAGQDGVNTQMIRTNSSGDQFVTGPALEGATASGAPVYAGGRYTGNATQPAVTTGQIAALQTDPAGNLRTAPQRPTSGDILVGYATVTATTASTVLATITAGRTWVGTLCASVDGNKAAAATGNGLVNATFLTVGTNVIPAAGTYFGVGASIGANAATGVTGTQAANQGCTPWTQVSPAGNTTTINYAATCTNTTACAAHVSAVGVMQ